MTRVEKLENTPWQQISLGPYIRKSTAEAYLKKLIQANQIQGGKLVEKEKDKDETEKVKYDKGIRWFIEGFIPPSNEPPINMTSMTSDELINLWSEKKIYAWGTFYPSQEEAENDRLRFILEGQLPNDVWIYYDKEFSCFRIASKR